MRIMMNLFKKYYLSKQHIIIINNFRYTLLLNVTLHPVYSNYTNVSWIKLSRGHQKKLSKHICRFAEDIDFFLQQCLFLPLCDSQASRVCPLFPCSWDNLWRHSHMEEYYVFIVFNQWNMVPDADLSYLCQVLFSVYLYELFLFA